MQARCCRIPQPPPQQQAEPLGRDAALKCSTADWQEPTLFKQKYTLLGALVRLQGHQQLHALQQQPTPQLVAALQRVGPTMCVSPQLSSTTISSLYRRMDMEGPLLSPLERCGPYLYTNTPLGSSHAVVRWHVDTGREEVLLSADILRSDATALERRLHVQVPELQVGHVKLSADQQLLAYTLPVSGSEEEAVCLVRDVCTGRLLDDCLLPAVHSMEWSAGGDVLLYTQPDHMGRPAKVMAHTLGRSRATDVLLLEETEPACFVSLSRTKDWSYLLLNSNSKLSSEVHLLQADAPLTHPPALLQRRQSGLEYFVEHHASSGQVLLLTNAHGATNYALMAVPAEQAMKGNTDMDQWHLLLPEDPSVAVLDMDAVAGGAVLLQMKDAKPQLTVVSLCSRHSTAANAQRIGNNTASSSSSSVSTSNNNSSSMESTTSSQVGAMPIQAHPDPAAECRPGPSMQVDTRQVLLPPWVTCVSPGVNQDYDSSTYRVTLSAPTHPGLVCDYHLDSQQLVVLQDLSCDHVFVGPGSESSTSSVNSSSSSSSHSSNPGDPNSRQGSSSSGDGFAEPGVTEKQSASHQRAVSSVLQVVASAEPCPAAASQAGAALGPASPLWAGPSHAGVECSLVWVTAGDGTKVPLTLISSSDGASGGAGPKAVLVLVYGAYGEVTQAGYQPYQLALLEQGWVVALPHVRGGGELGRRWHAAGRQQSKPNSATDLLACIHYLVDTGVTRPGLVTGHAASAGALTLAAALQHQPQLFAAAVLEVPFVDLLGGMSHSAVGAAADPNMHLLTQHEFDEWGNPEQPEVLDMMQRLCPYQHLLQRLAGHSHNPSTSKMSSGGGGSSSSNSGGSGGSGSGGGDGADDVVGRQARSGHCQMLAGQSPALLLTVGDLDARVPYWMPLRYAAAARAAAAADLAAAGAQAGAVPVAESAGSPLYVQVQEGGGHFGQGLLSQDAEQEAEVLAFLMHHVRDPKQDMRT